MNFFDVGCFRVGLADAVSAHAAASFGRYNGGRYDSLPVLIIAILSLVSISSSERLPLITNAVLGILISTTISVSLLPFLLTGAAEFHVSVSVSVF